MKIETCKILENKQIAPLVYQMKLGCDASWVKRSGQFVDVSIEGKKLKRPISLTSYTKDSLVLTYKVVGEGTKILSTKTSGTIEILTDCGNGFDLSHFHDEILMIGGGIGCAPLMGCIEEALKKGLKPKVIFGFRSESDSYFKEELEKMNVEYVFSYDVNNENVIDKMLEKKWDNLPFCTCGPIRMMENVCKQNHAFGLVSLETRMGCGFGACMGCSVKLKTGMKRICKEGPVFEKEEILWENLK